MTITIITIIQHGFYRGESTTTFAVKPEIAQEFVEQQIRKDYSFLGEKLTQSTVDKFIKDVFAYEESKERFCTGEGEYEVKISTADYIETL